MLKFLVLSFVLATNPMEKTSGGLTTKALEEKTTPIPGSKVLSTSYVVKPGSATDFLVQNMMKLEKSVTGFEKMDKAQLAAMDRTIKSIVSGSLDLSHLAERALSTYWLELGKTPKGKSQREQYRKLFKKLVEENYLEKARQYVSGKYQIPLTEEISSKGVSVIRGRILKRDVDLIVEFRLVKKKEGFRVIDVQLDETSLEATYRSSFNRIIRKEGGVAKGFPELMRVMEKRLAELEKGTATKL